MKLNKWGVIAGLIALVHRARRIRVWGDRLGRDRHPGGERRRALVQACRPTCGR